MIPMCKTDKGQPPIYHEETCKTVCPVSMFKETPKMDFHLTLSLLMTINVVFTQSAFVYNLFSSLCVTHYEYYSY